MVVTCSITESESKLNKESYLACTKISADGTEALEAPSSELPIDI